MKEIEKLDILADLDGTTLSSYETIENKINELVKVVNALIVTHPKLEERAKMHQEFKDAMSSS